MRNLRALPPDRFGSRIDILSMRPERRWARISQVSSLASDLLCRVREGGDRRGQTGLRWL